MGRQWIYEHVRANRRAGGSLFLRRCRVSHWGTGGIRKLRRVGSGRGKRGGIRAIYFWHAGPGAVYMLTAYAKVDRKDLTAADRKALTRLVASIVREDRQNDDRTHRHRP